MKLALSTEQKMRREEGVWETARSEREAVEVVSDGFSTIHLILGLSVNGRECLDQLADC